MIKKIALSMLLAGTAGAAFAAPTQDVMRHDDSFFSQITGFFEKPVPKPANDVAVVAAPEMDPASAVSGLTLLVGAIVVAAASRRRKTVQAA